MQNEQENTCAGVSFVKFQTSRHATFLKHDSSKEFRKVFKNTYFVEYLQTAASESVR